MGGPHCKLAHPGTENPATELPRSGPGSLPGMMQVLPQELRPYWALPSIIAGSPFVDEDEVGVFHATT
jgi:hypothetical protein